MICVGSMYCNTYIIEVKTLCFICEFKFSNYRSSEVVTNDAVHLY